MNNQFPGGRNDGKNTWSEGPSVSLTVRQELDMVASHLFNSYAKSRGGVVKVVQSLAHLWESIYEVKSDEPRIFVCYAGEQARGGFNQANTLFRVDRQFVVVIMRGHGFWNLLPDGTTKGPDKEFFTDSVEAVRDQIRVLLSISAEFPVDFKSVKPLQNMGPTRGGSAFLDAYAVEFSTANDIGRISVDQPS